MLTTPRLGLQKPQTSDASTGLRTSDGTNQDILDNALLYGQGLLAARPVSTPSTPGIAGREYRATDDTTGGANGTLYRDYGTGWFMVVSDGDARLAVAAAGTPSIRKLGTGATDAAAGNDSRLSDSRAPTGAAGGVLSGTYPNPGFAVDMATQAELDAALAALAAVPRLLKAREATMSAGQTDMIIGGTAGGAGSKSLSDTNGHQDRFYLPAPAIVAGKTAKIRLAGFIQGATAAMLTGNGTVTMRLHVATVSGGVVTLGTQIISDTIINNTTLAADAAVSHESAYVDHPGAGYYVVSLHSTRALDAGGSVGSVNVELNYQ